MAHQFPRKTMSLALQKKFASGILIELSKHDDTKHRHATIQFGDDLYALLSDPTGPDDAEPIDLFEDVPVILHDHNSNILYPVTIEKNALSLADINGIDKVFEGLIDDAETPTKTVTGFAPPAPTTTTTKSVAKGRGAIPPTPPSGELLELP